ncbi:MAG: hypothetical protein H6718_07190 [Polyangiaceae bacterium]|nr:hypothetical protein [Polyangiaceae bacterium]
MKGVYLGLVLAASACGLVAACGGDSSSEGSNGGTGGTLTSGGTGGTGGSSAGTGGTGGSAGNAGSAGTGAGGSGGSGAAGAGGTGGGGGGSVMCGTENCNDYSILGFNIPACCPDGIDNQCGVDVSQAEQFIGITGCVQENAPGDLDSSCPAYSPVAQLSFPGCCLPSGVCGNVADISAFGGPNMGCVDINAATDAGASQPCGSGTGGAGGTGGTGGSTGGTGGSTGGTGGTSGAAN